MIAAYSLIYRENCMTTPMDRFFKVTEAGSTLRREVRAGITTFLAMAYILFVNPQILSKAIMIPGVDNVQAQILTATALAAAFGSMMMGVVANYPIAVAPGMGLNAYFTYTVVLGHGIAWQTGLGAVFVSGIVFLMLSVSGLREAVINGIPLSLKRATAAGIGLFLAFIGATSSGLVVPRPVTYLGLGDITSPSVMLALGGLVVMSVLLARKTPGAMIIGVTIISILAIAFGLPVYGGKVFSGFDHGVINLPVWPKDLIFSFDLSGAMQLGVMTIVFTFLFVDFFDTAGTLIGLAEKAGFADKDGRIPRAGQVFATDALATSIGALLGTSTTTAYIESAAGIEEGGRTGLVAVVVSLLFLLSLFLWPLASAVPACATAPAMIILGAMMMESLGRLDWKEYRESIPAFLTMIGMPLTLSIANGITLGIVSYVMIHILSGKTKSMHPVMYVLAAVLAFKVCAFGG